MSLYNKLAFNLIHLMFVWRGEDSLYDKTLAVVFRRQLVIVKQIVNWHVCSLFLNIWRIFWKNEKLCNCVKAKSGPRELWTLYEAVIEEKNIIAVIKSQYGRVAVLCWLVPGVKFVLSVSKCLLGEGGSVDSGLGYSKSLWRTLTLCQCAIGHCVLARETKDMILAHSTDN